MIYIDMMSPVGHIRINRFYLGALWQAGDILLTGRNLSKHFSGFDKVLIKDNSSSLATRVFVFLQIIYQVFRVSDRKVCFLSYDLALMPILMFVLRVIGCRVIAFEHNTVPETTLKKIFQKASGKDLLHVTYAEHVSHTFEYLRLSSCVVDHPALVPERAANWPEVKCLESIKGSFEKIIYSPSGSVRWGDIKKVALEYPEYLFVFKGKPLSDEYNVISFGVIEGYFEMMSFCDAVYIPFDWKTKVSGPFFEAMAMGKIVVLKDNDFGRFCKSKFPDRVGFRISEIDFNLMPEFGIVDYNNEIVEKLNQIINT